MSKALKERKVSEQMDNKEAALGFKVKLGVLDSKERANKEHGEVNAGETASTDKRPCRENCPAAKDEPDLMPLP